MEATLQGVDEEIARLAGLTGAKQRRVVRSGMRKIASVINKDVKRRLPVGRTKQTRKSIGVVVKSYPSGITIAVVEPRAGYKVLVRITRSGRRVMHDPRRILHLIERGTAVRVRKSGGSTGASPAKPSFGPALSANATRAVEIMGAEVDKELAK